MSGVLGGCAKGCCPLINQFIVFVSLITQVNIAGDPRHVVTLVRLGVKIADPEWCAYKHMYIGCIYLAYHNGLGI